MIYMQIYMCMYGLLLHVICTVFSVLCLYYTVNILKLVYTYCRRSWRWLIYNALLPCLFYVYINVKRAHYCSIHYMFHIWTVSCIIVYGKHISFPRIILYEYQSNERYHSSHIVVLRYSVRRVKYRRYVVSVEYRILNKYTCVLGLCTCVLDKYTCVFDQYTCVFVWYMCVLDRYTCNWTLFTVTCWLSCVWYVILPIPVQCYCVRSNNKHCNTCFYVIVIFCRVSIIEFFIYVWCNNIHIVFNACTLKARSTANNCG